MLFGGQLTYKKRVPILDEAGNPTYTKKKENWPLSKGVAVHPKDAVGIELDTYKSGAKAGQLNIKQ